MVHRWYTGDDHILFGPEIQVLLKKVVTQNEDKALNNWKATEIKIIHKIFISKICKRLLSVQLQIMDYEECWQNIYQVNVFGG